MFVEPSVFLIGTTKLDRFGLKQYLDETDQADFDISEPDDFEVLSSFFAKLCYKSLVTGKNKNITKVRDTYDNVIGTMASGHGSVFEHFTMNFVFTNVSRVCTHELVRHRVGTAFSQTSGRYVRTDEIDFILPPELDPYHERIYKHIRATERLAKELAESMGVDNMPMDAKKRATSAIRRIAPNGQANEIGFSCNVRELRHVIHMRTSRHAEWEIRLVFGKVANIIYDKSPLLLHGFSVENVNGLEEWQNTLDC